MARNSETILSGTYSEPRTDIVEHLPQNSKFFIDLDHSYEMVDDILYFSYINQNNEKAKLWALHPASTHILFLM